jgi:hypothetical protein
MNYVLPSSMNFSAQAKPGRVFTLIELPTLARARQKGRTIHAGGRCRGFLDDHVQFIKDSQMPM